MMDKEEGKIIGLAEIEAPDCPMCKEKTKRISGKTFDIEGPGMVGVLYDCKNERCKKQKREVEAFQLRAAGVL